MMSESSRASDQELVSIVCAEFFQVVYGSLRLEMSAAQKGRLYDRAKAGAIHAVSLIRREERMTEKRKAKSEPSQLRD